MYLAEFAFPGTTELVNELLIHAPSERVATKFARDYASHWEVELFSLVPANEKQARLCRLAGNAISVEMV